MHNEVLRAFMSIASNYPHITNTHSVVEHDDLDWEIKVYSTNPNKFGVVGPYQGAPRYKVATIIDTAVVLNTVDSLETMLAELA